MGNELNRQDAKAAKGWWVDVGGMPGKYKASSSHWYKKGPGDSGIEGGEFCAVVGGESE